MKKVLHIIDALNVGGAQELLALMAKHKGSTFDMAVCVLQPGTSLKARIESYGVRVYALDRTRESILRPVAFLRYGLGNLFDIIRICRDEQVDIVHAHLSDAEYLGFFATILGRARYFFTTVHTPALLPESQGHNLRNLARSLLMRVIHARAKKVVAVSKDTAALLHRQSGVSQAKLRIIANGVETKSIANHQPTFGRDALGLDGSDHLLLCVGRLTLAKGHSYLLEAMRLLLPSLPNVKLLIAGDGELREELEELARSLKITDSVFFLGSRKDIPDLLALSDTYVSASVFEGTSLAVMEAMSAGKPIVGTNIPGNLELLEQNVNAVLVPPADAQSLADAITRLCGDAQLAATLGRNAQKKAHAEFDIMAVIRKYVDAWGIA